ncbi:acetyl-CoA carboxylase carboxyltransferase subunit alpha/beta [Clostridium fungisolvens]|uniref:Multifunctional fusion protein n=1 Tax=Clostridium fungisolvens TaxID=1604897 RepID=A0A6V8SLH5_9CLOT|nr:acetyl-CoA carboxylase carboxyltransferase subunit alpha/beta [Clostridium fungisolvens]GFP77750.1 Acetyl-coenzyme A carboxylase carboxyl transferase subunit beta, chloroplastic [Clostridium fungisolvens]
MGEWLSRIGKRKLLFEKENVNIDFEVEKEVLATLQTKDKELIVKCPSCNGMLTNKQLIDDMKVCRHCAYHFRFNSTERVNLIFDKDSIVYLDENLVSCNPLDFPNYNEKLKKLKESLEIKEAVTTGKGNIKGREVYFGIMDYRFVMGSMGSVVGEKLTRMIEEATKVNKPIVIFSASGGARMQEGMISLYQMAKVVSAIERHSKKGLLYISILTDPTTGGVLASFASIADIVISEPNSTIGFAGKRVVKNALNRDEVQDFQISEFHLENGHIDFICERKDLRDKLSNIFDLYCGTNMKWSGINNYDIRAVNKAINSAYYKYSERSAWDKVKLARSNDRPNFQQYISSVLDGFIELKGDRISADDQAIITGIGKLNNMAVTVILNAKGKVLEENMLRNFGMTKPEGYRKVVRITKLAEKFRLPVICFIDTPGASCDFHAEKMGQAYAIANSIRTFSDLKVPIISIVSGEGGSGGALAIGVADWIFMLENSIYSVISPEGCNSILFKGEPRIEQCCEYLKLTSKELLKLNIIDEVLPEFDGNKSRYEEEFYNMVKVKLYNKLIELIDIDVETLVDRRYDRFRGQGIYEDLTI